MSGESESKIRVSVLMPTFNHEKYITQAIESVISQKTTFRFELLIGDDASTDSTAEIARSYMNRYPDKIRFYPRENNVGPTRNGYDLMCRAAGDYLATCEGDDFWTDENKLQKQLTFMDAHREYSACTHKIVFCDMNGNVINTNPSICWISHKRDYSISDFHGIFLPGHPVSLFRRNILRDSKQDLSIIYKADSMISDRTIAMIWASRGKIRCMSDNMAAYRLIRKAGSANVTSILYLNINGNEAIQHDYTYTMNLLNYAMEQNNFKVDFDYHLAELYASCIYQKLKKGVSTGDLRKQISKSCRHSFYCVAMFPIISFKRILEKIHYYFGGNSQ